MIVIDDIPQELRFTDIYTLRFEDADLEWDEELAHDVVVALADEFDLWTLTSFQRRVEPFLRAERQRQLAALHRQEGDI